MAFGKITKQDLVEAGLDPDKFTDLIGKAVTKEQLDTLKTELTTSINTSITDQIKAGFTELENKLKTPPKGNNDNKGSGGNNDDGNNEPDDQTRFLTDPTGYVKTEVHKLGWAANVEFKKMSRNLAWDSMSNNPNLVGFKNAELRKEIEEEWKNYPPELFAKNNGDPSVTLKQVHDMVVGRHHEDIQRDTNKKDGKYNIVQSDNSTGGFNNGPNDGSNRNNNKKQLSEEDKAFAAKFGMTEDEWIKQEEDMEKEEKERHKKVLVRT